MNLKNYINQTFPKAQNKWKIIFSISTFIALFLIIFQPFNLNLYHKSDKYLILLGYGLVAFFVMVFNMIILESIFKKFYDERNWKIWKEFISLLWMIFTIGLGNAIYTLFVFGLYFENNFAFLVQFQFITLVVGIIPITVLIITKQKYLLRKHLGAASEIEQHIGKKTNLLSQENIHFEGETKKDCIDFCLNYFYFIESSGNYIEFHLLQNGTIVRKTLRSTLKKAALFFEQYPEIIQCHRAFIVNSSKITNTQGNSQGLRLTLENCTTEVNVSRNFVSKVKQASCGTSRN